MYTFSYSITIHTAEPTYHLNECYVHIVIEFEATLTNRFGTTVIKT
jgi:hypothetical protein